MPRILSTCYGAMAYRDKARKGQTNEFLAEQDILFYGILHSKLRSFDLLEKILYHLVAGVTHTFSDEGTHKPFVDNAKERVIKHLRLNTKLYIDTPTSFGGNTNTGRMADLFLDPKNRTAICALIVNPDHCAKYSLLV